MSATLGDDAMKAAASLVAERAPIREEWRDALFAIIDAAVPMLEEEAPRSDEQRRLTAPVLEFLRDQDLLKLKLPQELGGAEGDNALQFEVYEKLAYHNAAASWCCFIYTDMLALAGSVMTDVGVAQLTQRGLPLVCGGGGRIVGKLTQVQGGYRVSGRWAYGSGLAGSDWIAVMAADGSDAAPMMCLVATRDTRSLDNWDVLGLRGSGSSDFVIEDAFVPDAMAFRVGSPALRGGPNFRLGVVGLIAHTVPAVALGVARRSLDDLVAFARAKQRGYLSRQTIGDRAAFQAFIATADLRLKAARALMIENGQRLAAIAAADAGTAEIEAEARAAGTWATEQAVQVASDIIRWAGGDAIRQGSTFERALRDIHVAATHYSINNTSLEGHGQHVLGLTDVLTEA